MPDIQPYGLAPGSAAGHPQPPPELLERVLAALPHVFEDVDGTLGRLFDIVDDTGGLGLCKDATVDLLAALDLGPWYSIWIDINSVTVVASSDKSLLSAEVPSDYPKVEGCGEHCIAVVDGWAVDITARQFDDELPFPFFWRVKPQ